MAAHLPVAQGWRSVNPRKVICPQCDGHMHKRFEADLVIYVRVLPKDAHGHPTPSRRRAWYHGTTACPACKTVIEVAATRAPPSPDLGPAVA